MFNLNFKKMRVLPVVIVSFIVGVFLTVFVYQALTIFQLRNQVANDHVTLTQVVDFLNQNIQQAQQKTGTTQQVSAPKQEAAPEKK
jgi:Tfp pilus assembly protein PilE